MVKESIMFVAATGLLIYFMTPSDDPAKPEAAALEGQKTVTPAAQSADDIWGYDDEDDNDESFTFGEPITDLAGDGDEKSQEEDDSSNRQRQSETTESKTTSFSSSRKTASANSPGSGQIGSINNPIILKTNDPSDPADD